MNENHQKSNGFHKINIILIRLIGAGSIVWGIYMLSAFPEVLVKAPYYLHPVSFWDFLKKSFMELVSSIGFIFSGYGLLKLKPWAKYWFISVILFYLIPALFSPLIMWGSIIQTSYYLKIVFVSFGLILFFSLSSVRNLFPYKKKVSSVLLCYLMVYIFLGGLAAWVFFEYETHDFDFEHIEKLPNPSFTPPIERWDQRELPFKFSLAIPKNSIVFGVMSFKSGEFLKEIDLLNPWKSGILTLEMFYITETKSRCMIELSNWSIIQMYARNWGPLVGISDEQQMTDLLLSEKYGLAGWGSRVTYFPQKIESYDIDGFQVYLIKSNKEKHSNDSILIYQDSQFVGEVKTSCSQGRLAESILSTIKLQNNSKIEAEDYLREGNLLMENQKFKEATFAYGSAFFLDNNNPDYLLRLAEAQAQTELFIFANLSLKKALEIDPNLNGAKKLKALLKRKSEENDKEVEANRLAEKEN